MIGAMADHGVIADPDRLVEDTAAELLRLRAPVG